MTRTRNWLGLGAALVLAVLLWWTQGDGGSAPEPTGDGGGFRVVALADLPAEAARTVELIDAGGPFPYDQDDGVFMNREELLPDRPEGHYREYTVETPGSDDRGARRIVAGGDGLLYWTDDHYASFSLIER